MVVEGNLIGTDSSGASTLGNQSDGILVDAAASNNTIGGSVSGSGNVIAFNVGSGVQIGDDTSDDSTGNAILENSIYSNTSLGINLGSESSPSGNPVTNPSSARRQVRAGYRSR